ncbi:LysR family transcriptional regulator [Lachnospiraceae bacterium 45-W7]
MNINYEYYRIFYYVAEYKNLTQAAKVLHNSQPNISRTIKLLENEIGCSLLIRSNRGISLTPEGKKLYFHVKEAVSQIQLAEEELADSASLRAGCVTIGVSETALRMLVLPVLQKFKRDYPDIRIRILNHLTNQAVESVKNGEADFAVATMPCKIEKPLVTYPLIYFRDVLLGGPAYFRFRGKKWKLEELVSYPLICLGEETITYEFYEQFYHRHGLLFKPELQAATTDQILPMIKNDLGIGYIPEIFARAALDQGNVCCISLEEEIPQRQICFVENQRHPLNVAARELKVLLTSEKSLAGKN